MDEKKRKGGINRRRNGTTFLTERERERYHPTPPPPNDQSHQITIKIAY